MILQIDFLPLQYYNAPVKTNYNSQKVFSLFYQVTLVSLERFCRRLIYHQLMFTLYLWLWVISLYVWWAVLVAFFQGDFSVCIADSSNTFILQSSKVSLTEGSSFSTFTAIVNEFTDFSEFYKSNDAYMRVHLKMIVFTLG